MLVETSPTHAALCPCTDPVGRSKEKFADQTPDSKKLTAHFDAAKAPPITGVSGNTLSKEVLDQLISAQDINAQETEKHLPVDQRAATTPSSTT